MQNSKFVPNAGNVSHTSNNTHSGSNAEHAGQGIKISRISDLAKEIDPSLQLDEEVEEMMFNLTDSFIDNVINGSCLLAKHRRAANIEVKDVQLHLERMFNMWIPGFGTEELRQYKEAPASEEHKQRLALIRKTLKEK